MTTNYDGSTGDDGDDIGHTVDYARAAVARSLDSTTTEAKLRVDVTTLGGHVIGMGADLLRLHRILAREAEPEFGPMRGEPDGKVSVQVTDPLKMGEVIGSHFAAMLDGAGAQNYVEMTFTPRGGGPDDRITVTVQRWGKVTPHHARVEAETQLKRAVAVLAEHGIPWDGPTEFPPTEAIDVKPDDCDDTPWLRIDPSKDPNQLHCERCGTREDIPGHHRAGVFRAMLDEFKRAHGACEVGDEAARKAIVRPK